MSKLTLEQLKELDHGIKLNGTDDLNELFELAWEEGRISEIKQLLSQVLNHDQKIKWVIFAAKSVLGVSEEVFPEDDRPRKAIESAETYLSNPTEENRLACEAASAEALAVAAARASTARASADAYASTEAYVTSITHAAPYNSFQATYDSAYTAAYDFAISSDAVAYAAYAAYASAYASAAAYSCADYADRVMDFIPNKKEVYEYGIKLLTGEENEVNFG